MTNAPPPRVAVKQFLVERFSENDLEDMAFDLCVPYENLRRETKDQLARQLIQYCEQRDLLGCLILEVIKRRQNQAAHFEQYLGMLPCKSLSKIQIIVPNERASEIGNLLVAFAQAHQVPLTEFKVICAAPGSIRLLVALPTDSSRGFGQGPTVPAELQVIPPDQFAQNDLQVWRAIYVGGVSAVIPTESNVIKEVIGGVFGNSVLGKAMHQLLDVLYPQMKNMAPSRSADTPPISAAEAQNFGFRSFAAVLNEYLERAA